LIDRSPSLSAERTQHFNRSIARRVLPPSKAVLRSIACIISAPQRDISAAAMPNTALQTTEAAGAMIAASPALSSAAAAPTIAVRLDHGNFMLWKGLLLPNFSGAQLHGAFAQRVSEVLDKHRLEPSALMLELTESVLMKAGTEATEVLKGLDALGVPLALDDFGTGFSSLSYLHRAKVHTVKIDQSFVSGMSSDGTRRAIVEAVVALTRALGLRVIAEGVDTPEQIDLLVGMGCEFAQGFLVALPMPPVAMGEYLTVAHSHCVGGR